MYRRTVCPMYLSKLYIMIETYFLTLSSLSGFTVVYCLYFYSFSIHFRDQLAIILNVTVGFLSLLYLLLFSSGFGIIGFLSLLYPYYSLLLSCSQFQPVPFFNSPTLLKLSLLFYSLFLFSLQREQVYYFPPFTEDEFLLMFIAFVLQ